VPMPWPRLSAADTHNVPFDKLRAQRLRAQCTEVARSGHIGLRAEQGTFMPAELIEACLSVRDAYHLVCPSPANPNFRLPG